MIYREGEKLVIFENKGRFWGSDLNQGRRDEKESKIRSGGLTWVMTA